MGEVSIGWVILSLIVFGIIFGVIILEIGALGNVSIKKSVINFVEFGLFFWIIILIVGIYIRYKKMSGWFILLFPLAPLISTFDINELKNDNRLKWMVILFWISLIIFILLSFFYWQINFIK